MKTILIIENIPDILDNLIEAFEMEGYNVLTANNGTTGVEMASEHLPDLIVSGILIGKTTGYEVLKALIDDRKTSEIPFIFSTTVAEKKHRAFAFELGADDYIVKPYQLEDLFSMAKRCIQFGTKRAVKKVYFSSNALNFSIQNQSLAMPILEVR